MHQHLPQGRISIKLLSLPQNWRKNKNLLPAHSHGAANFLGSEKWLLRRSLISRIRVLFRTRNQIHLIVILLSKEGRECLKAKKKVDSSYVGKFQRHREEFDKGRVYINACGSLKEIRLAEGAKKASVCDEQSEQ